jgi:hypothetical protein
MVNGKPKKRQTELRDESLRLLGSGRESWNRWRLQHEYAPLSLIGLRLPGADLRGFDLRGCDLRRAVLPRVDASALVAVRCNLAGADLTEAVLSGAAMGGASLAAVSLHGADLSGTDLTETVLNDADLSETDLQGADLRWATVENTRLDGAVLGWTMLANVDISKARGLGRTIHRAPSTLGLDVVERASRRLPEAFLRGVGVAEDYVSLLSSPLGKRRHLPSTFISYSFKDSEFAKKLHDDLQRSGIRCWLAERSLNIGEPIYDTIAETIRTFDAVIVVLSADAIKSSWVQTEVEHAVRKAHETRTPMILPVKIDDSVDVAKRRWVAQLRVTRKIGDFIAWQDALRYAIVFEDLLNALGRKGQVTAHPRWR